MKQLIIVIIGAVMLFECFSENIAYCTVSKKMDQKELAKANLITIPFMENKGQLTLQRYLMIYDKFTQAPFPVRQISTMVPVLYPSNLFEQTFKGAPLHG